VTALTSIIGRLFFLVTVAMARDPTVDPCLGVPGGCPPENVLVKAIDPIAGFLFIGAEAGAVLFVVIGGAQMILSMGDDSKAQKGRTSVILALFGYILALASQTVVHFVHTHFMAVVTETEKPGVAIMATIVRMTVALFNITFAAVVVYAGFRLVISWGKAEEHTKAWNSILWAVTGAVIINVAGALVRAVTLTGLS
jgi:hypothetical protein